MEQSWMDADVDVDVDAEGTMDVDDKTEAAGTS